MTVRLPPPMASLSSTICEPAEIRNLAAGPIGRGGTLKDYLPFSKRRHRAGYARTQIASFTHYPSPSGGLVYSDNPFNSASSRSRKNSCVSDPVGRSERSDSE